jgi:peptide-methionine (S)-S-oxide reductase
MQTILLLALLSSVLGGQTPRFPPPARDAAPGSGEQVAVLAGGCFWGVEAVFEEIAGVKDVVSGFAGGAQSSANYAAVTTGATGHAEAVKVTFDPARVSYGRLLEVFFAVAHNPTELNRQGPDEGPQYRSSIFFSNAEQKAVANAYIRQLNDARVFKAPIATTVVPLDGFYAAEPAHQNFVARNPNYPYVVHNDLPKLEHLRKDYPDLLKRR